MEGLAGDVTSFRRQKHSPEEKNREQQHFRQKPSPGPGNVQSSPPTVMTEVNGCSFTHDIPVPPEEVSLGSSKPRRRSKSRGRSRGRRTGMSD